MRFDEVRQALTAYVHGSPEELEHRRRMLALLDDSGAFSRKSFLPGHFTASAFVLSPERDALLLILHKKLGLWLQPGGHVDPADGSLFAAARREVVEEVGVEPCAPSGAPPFDGAPFDLDVHEIPMHKAEPAHLHFDVRFCFLAPTRELRINHEVVRAEWAPLDRLAERTTDASVLRAGAKLLGLVR